MKPHHYWLCDRSEWCMTTQVVFPEFSPDHHIAQDPEPELHHPFAFVETRSGAKGYFITDGTDWARVSKEDWDHARDLFHSNEEDDGPLHDKEVEGVLANFEFQRVTVELVPGYERGELEVRIWLHEPP